MGIKLVNEVRVYDEVYVDKGVRVYRIQDLYVDRGEFGDLGIGDNGDNGDLGNWR